MRLRNRLLLLVAGTVAVAVSLVTWFVSSSARTAFESIDDQRTAALVAQWRREFAREGDAVAREVQRVSATETIEAIALDVASNAPDPAAHVDKAGELAAAHGLDFLDVVTGDGTILSSARWPARFGYKRSLPAGRREAVVATTAFLQGEETAEGMTLALLALVRVRAGDAVINVVGGKRLDPPFLAALGIPAGMRLLLYRGQEPAFVPAQLIDGAGTAPDADRFETLVRRARLGNEIVETVALPAGPETIQAIPLRGGDGRVAAVLLVASSRRELAALVATIRRTGLAVGGLGVALGFLLSYLLAARVTRPIEQLADGARRVAAGDWGARMEAGGSGEVGALSAAFDVMTGQLVEQRERLVQVERVAAWRELARRLAHELKNPLFPLRLTVENLQRARGLPPAEFDEVFAESTETLSTGLGSLTRIIGRFSDFAKMPRPEFEDVDLNAVVRRTTALVDARLTAPGQPRIAATLDLDDRLGRVRADPEQLGRALQNLLLNAIDAMPDGGRMWVTTRRTDNGCRISVADSGEGLTEEERTRLFTPYYTTKQHGTGLGLAIVQSVVSDHGGRIRVESQPGAGTTFVIDLEDPPGGPAGDAAPAIGPESGRPTPGTEAGV